MSSAYVDDKPPVLDRDGSAAVLRGDADVLDVARELADELRSSASERDRAGRYPAAALEQVASSGLLAAGIPVEWGGAGAGAGAVIEVIRLLATADASVAQTLQPHFQLVDAVLLDGGTELQSVLLPDVVAGGRVGNAIAERGAADGAQHSTLFRQTDEGTWELDGSKYYCTGAPGSSWLGVAVRGSDDTMSLGFTRTERDGITVTDDWAGMGQRSTGSGTVTFAAVRVPDTHVIRPWAGAESRRATHYVGRLLHAAIDIGTAEGALADGLRFLAERARPAPGRGFRHAGDDPLVQRSVGAATARVHAGRALLAHAASLLEYAVRTEKNVDMQAAVVAAEQVKGLAAELAVEISSEVFAWCGGSAADERLNLNRYWRDARTHTLHDPAQWAYATAGAEVVSAIGSGTLPDFVF
ncbi:acyl-CoA dehydrogenase family protein [Rhodococcus sp. HM1]|nr:acyl-CoA dehydrogenase family protein [Rhodococcus sp. HM1]MBH0119181.1 acyl-CoA dehydrogenase family protein [Rhodococcus sp. CX]MCK8672414.1 acyl-CoA dehydrogenase family protein [Rhodococcus sp. HM1]